MLIVVFALSNMMGFLFFFVGLYEGVFQRKEGNFARAIICHLVSLPFCILVSAMSLTSGGVYGSAFQWGFVFFTFMDFILIIINGWQAYLIWEESKPNRNRRYGERR
jgi:hypothetical protein